jgi:hypothetical protein
MRPSGGKLVGLGLLGALLIGLVWAGLQTHLPGALDEGSEARKAAFTAFGAAATLVYFAAAWLVLRGKRARHAVWLVLGVALAMRLLVLTQPAFLSTDLFRYVWDGRVQLAGIDPYRYIPDDPAVASLRDGTIYPFINRHESARTIYPPAAQLVFRAIAAVSQTQTAERLTMVGFEIVAIVAILRMLTIAGLDPARVLIYAWNPLSVWEFAGNGHVDAMAIGLLAVAMLARTRGRDALTGVATGALLGLAVLVKFLPLIAAPALWRPRGARRWMDWTMPAALALVIALLYALYLNSTFDVLGFLPGYANEEGLGTGAGIYWLDALGHLVALPAGISALWLPLAALVLLALGVWMVFVRRPAAPGDPTAVARDVAVLATALTAAITPHYAWYFVWLALPACLAPIPSVIYLSAAAILQYHDPFPDGIHDHVLQFSAIYLPFLLLAANDLLRRRIRGPASIEAVVRSI